MEIAFTSWLESHERIENLLNGNRFVIFLQKGDDLFGGDEDSRMTFARMKGDDADLPCGWKKEANFLAMNLPKCLSGGCDTAKSLFGMSDIPKLRVVDREEVVADLLRRLAS